MRNPTYRVVIIVALALWVGGLIIAAVLVLARGDGNTPIEVIIPSSQVIIASPDTATESKQTSSGSSLSPTMPVANL
jgi:hypothetical protein